jgi:phage terminase small subunit
MTLRPKQARSVEEYLIDLNAAQAAISAKTARIIGYEDLTKPYIAAAIETALAKRSKRAGLTGDMVIDELRKIAFANMGDYLRAQPGGDPYPDFSMLTRDQAAALREVTVNTYVEGHGENARAVRLIKFKLGDRPPPVSRTAPESQVRTRLPDGARGIRTLGPPSGSRKPMKSLGVR